MSRNMFSNESGNVFAILFGAVAMVATLGYATYNMISGPITTMTRVNQKAMIDTQLMAASKISVMDATSNFPSSGDCDADSWVEPREWRDPAAASSPASVAGANGGGYIPDALGVQKLDPYGTEYGYCVWNAGAANIIGGVAGCDNDNILNASQSAAGDTVERRLIGDPGDTSGPIIVIYSAGANRTFESPCRNFVDTTPNDGEPDLPMFERQGDDVVVSYTYAEASASGAGGLWAIKTGDPDVAVIDKEVEMRMAVGGTGGTGGFVDKVLDAQCLTINDLGLMRYNPVDALIEVCEWDGAAASWGNLGAGETESFIENDGSSTCTANDTNPADGVPDDSGRVRYNSTNGKYEVCDGALPGWREIVLGSTSAQLTFSPTSKTDFTIDNFVTIPSESNTFDVTLQNTGTADSQVLTWNLTNTTNFEIVSETCSSGDGLLNPAETCTFTLKFKSYVDGTFSGILQVNVDNLPQFAMQGTAAGVCTYDYKRDASNNIYGYRVNCETGYELVAGIGGCADDTSDPDCSPAMDYILKKFADADYTDAAADMDDGPANTTVLIADGQSNPAAEFCDSLAHGGYSDWYLPAPNELLHLYNAKNAGFVTDATNAFYISSKGNLGSDSTQVRLSDGNIDYWEWKQFDRNFRCFRRDYPIAPPVGSDHSPDNLSDMTRVAVGTGGTRVYSPAFIFTGYDSANVTIAGTDGSPEVMVNGSVTGTNVSILPGDSIQFSMVTNAAAGTIYEATLTVGDLAPIKVVAIARGASANARLFVTSSTYRPDQLESLANADAICQKHAEGQFLSGSWKALISSAGESNSIATRLDYANWDTVTDMSGNVIFDVNDLWNPAIIPSNPIREEESGGTIADGSYVFTGTYRNGFGDNAVSAFNCNNLNYISGDWHMGNGRVGYLSDEWIERSPYAHCYDSSYSRMYCIEDDPTQPASGTPPWIGQDCGGSCSGVQRRVFVTAQKFRGNFGGITGVDNTCQQAAEFANLGGTWKGLISGTDSSDWALNRIDYNWESLTLVDGTIVHTGNSTLWSSPYILNHPINMTAYGTDWSTVIGADDEVHTNTGPNGTATSTNVSDAYGSCQNWTSDSGSYRSYGGEWDELDSRWISDGSYGNCDYYLHHSLYCIEISDSPAPVAVPSTNDGSCKQIKDDNPAATDGEYTIDMDGTGPLPSMTAYCDMTTDGGGWTLILNYVHQNNTNPPKQYLTNTLPIIDPTLNVLGDDGSANLAAWGHSTPTLLEQIHGELFNELRFSCQTSGHSRVMNFKTTHDGLRNYVRTGFGSTDVTLNNWHTALTGHTANSPFYQNSVNPYQGVDVLTDNPFYDSYDYEWAIGEGDDWDCDDDQDNDDNDTIHRVWFR